MPPKFVYPRRGSAEARSIGDEKPRELWSPTHCSPAVLLGLPMVAAVAARKRLDGAVCPYCGKGSDASWRAVDLANGKRLMPKGSGIEYHCELAYYGAS